MMEAECFGLFFDIRLFICYSLTYTTNILKYLLLFGSTVCRLFKTLVIRE